MHALLLVAAALIAAELIHRRDRELATDDECHRFSVAGSLAVAAAILLGPLPAFLVVTVSIGGVRRLQGDGWRDSGIRALSLGVGALAGGYAYLLAGSETGSVVLPDDLLGLVLLGVVFAVAKTLFVRVPLGATSLDPDLPAATAEVALAATVAIAVDAGAWNAALLVPVLLLLEQLDGRALALRHEIASALETFANLVDERDPTTHCHSQRVAHSVRELAEALGLPRSDVRRLWWAGRLHDLGKVAVDAAVLRKRGPLTAREWAAVRRAPRLSARLLQRFRFAAQQAKAVEYHRERLDGSGYYGARGDDIPLAAHFLIVADAFDAMTSERPFRPALTHDDALAEIERNAGTQFHPVIAKAFVAVQRGQRPEDTLTAGELAAIREASVPGPRRPGLGKLGNRPELVFLAGGAITLLGLGAGLVELTVAGAGVAAAGLGMSSASRVRSTRLRNAVDAALANPNERATTFETLAGTFAGAWRQDFAALVAWSEDGAGGVVELSRGRFGVPPAELTSWLLRGSESGQDVIVDDGAELGRTGSAVALPLRRENSALVGFLVLGGARSVPRHLLDVSRSRLGRIGLALADAPAPERRARRLAS